MQFSFSIAFDFSFERVVVSEQVCSKSSLFFFLSFPDKSLSALVEGLSVKRLMVQLLRMLLCFKVQQPTNKDAVNAAAKQCSKCEVPGGAVGLFVTASLQ